MDDSRTGDVGGVAQAADAVVEPGVGDVRAVGLPRKLRRHLKALERRANRRLLRAAYRELKTLRHMEGQRMFQTNDLERAELGEVQ